MDNHRWLVLSMLFDAVLLVAAAVILSRACGLKWRHSLATATVVLLLVAVLAGQCFGADFLALDIPVEQRQRFWNSDGSCVQCAIGMVGVNMNIGAAEMLLWNSQYGSRVRGGAGPSRVRAYCNARGIPAYNVTGNTMPWIEWALKTGRGCAVQWGKGHMVTAVGMSTDGQRFAVCDNNTPQRVDWYSRAEFTQKHYPWVVILRGPIPANQPPVYYPWWEK